MSSAAEDAIKDSAVVEYADPASAAAPVISGNTADICSSATGAVDDTATTTTSETDDFVLRELPWGDVPKWILHTLEQPLKAPSPPPPPPAPPGEKLSDRVCHLSKNFCKRGLELAAEQHAQRADLEEEFCEVFENIEEEEVSEMTDTLMRYASMIKVASQREQEVSDAAAMEAVLGRREEDDAEDPVRAAPLFLVDQREMEQKEGSVDADGDKEDDHRHFSQIAYEKKISAEDQKRMEDFQRSRQPMADTEFEQKRPATSASRGYNEFNNVGDVGAAHKIRVEENKPSCMLLAPKQLATLKRNRLQQQQQQQQQQQKQQLGDRESSASSFLYRDRLCRPADQSGIKPVAGERLSQWVATPPGAYARSNGTIAVVSPETSPVFYAARREAEVAIARKELEAATSSARKMREMMADMVRSESIDQMMEAARSNSGGCVDNTDVVKPNSSALETRRVRKVLPPRFSEKDVPEPDGFVVEDDQTMPAVPLPSVMREQGYTMRS